MCDVQQSFGRQRQTPAVDPVLSSAVTAAMAAMAAIAATAATAATAAATAVQRQRPFALTRPVTATGREQLFAYGSFLAVGAMGM